MEILGIIGGIAAIAGALYGAYRLGYEAGEEHTILEQVIAGEQAKVEKEKRLADLNTKIEDAKKAIDDEPIKAPTLESMRELLDSIKEEGV